MIVKGHQTRKDRKDICMKVRLIYTAWRADEMLRQLTITQLKQTTRLYNLLCVKTKIWEFPSHKIKFPSLTSAILTVTINCSIFTRESCKNTSFLFLQQQDSKYPPPHSHFCSLQ